MLSNRNDYERPDRFKHPTKAENQQKLIRKIAEIISDADDDTFKSSGKISQLLGIKNIYVDERVRQLNKLFSDDSFQKKSSNDQYATIKKTLKNFHTSIFSKVCVEKNDNATHFITAIQNDDLAALMKIHKKICQHHDAGSRGIRNLYSFLLSPLDRERRLFSKVQALAAAYWWLDKVKYDVLEMIDLLNNGNTFKRNKKNSEPLQSIQMTPLQERIFVTTLADIIWEKCQEPHLNIKGQAALYVDYDYVRPALKKAKISIKEDTKLKQASIIAFVCQNGEVTYQWGGEIGTIYHPEKSAKYNDFYTCKVTKKKILPTLPDDDIIRYRDMLSTLLTAKPDSESNICMLPKELVHEIVVAAKPKHVSKQNAENQIAWNQRRLQDLNLFSRLEKVNNPLLKITFDHVTKENTHLKAKNK